MEIEYDVWFDNNGKAFGEGCFRLLEAVEKTGSLNKAAADVNLSFCGAFRTLQKSEKRLGFALLERKIGGISGGGSCLTPQAKILVAQYRQFNDELSETVRHIFKKHFYFDQPAKYTGDTCDQRLEDLRTSEKEQ